ncbi:MAG TPA: hypothetical protein VN445_14365 [Rectinemataceae bacterium]|nr:hypothetical protein [Rectinemataceae bacterium]
MNIKKIAFLVLIGACVNGTALYANDQIEEESAVEKQQSDRVQKRSADLTFLYETLRTVHPDLFGRAGKDAFDRRTDEILRSIREDAISDVEFGLDLQTLVALARDSHTSLNIGKILAKDSDIIPFALAHFEEGWTATILPKGKESYLGWQVISLAGIPVDQVCEKMAPLFSHDNTIRLRRQFRQYVSEIDILKYCGILSGSENSIPLELQSFASSDRVVVALPVMRAATEDLPICRLLPAEIIQRPATDYNRKALYFWEKIDPSTLYIQYNQCRNDKKYPMEKMASEIAETLKSNDIKKIVLDLRNNSGGSDGVIGPLMPVIEQSVKAGIPCSALLGEATFSSATINAVMLREIGCVWVGTPTSGNANHFGSVNAFTLPNSGLSVSHSTKYINLNSYFNGGYSDSPLIPNMIVEQKLSDYLNGRDTAIDCLIKE